jgi:transcriptional regulator with XRE-family HTH domain
MLDMSRADLAERAGIAERTVIDFERGARQPLTNNLAAIRRALEKAGALFIDSNGGGPGVRLKRKVKR